MHNEFKPLEIDFLLFYFIFADSQEYLQPQTDNHGAIYSKFVKKVLKGMLHLSNMDMSVTRFVERGNIFYKIHSHCKENRKT